jgi:hypothetical protein
MPATSKPIVSPRRARKSSMIRAVDSKIIDLRRQRVMLDRDLAEVYGVTTKVLNQAVKRNSKRFPPDFCFRLKAKERDEVVTNCDHLRSLKFSASLPFAFTEHGAIMAATVLNSVLAVEMSVFVVRAFVRFRESTPNHGEVAQRLTELEGRVAGHDADLTEMFLALRKLIVPAGRPRRRIGFATKSEK